jgi:predicted RNA binding protein YcfA (HicA-like mRNA interferase family)
MKGVDMNPRKITISAMEQNGFEFKRHGANHDLYFNPITKQTIPVKRHDFNENDMRYIFKEAGIQDKN